ncbi:O-methyltransferase [Aeromonas jandaei]|uniref:O-methyltransferase n=1 Tax=Aeromonas jandaei TaxID=650 RepID=UPI003B9DFCE6
MSKSGRKINYGLRPAKSIERKMMRDMFLRMLSGLKLTDYQYIGFGAKYFIDFNLFHKSLHIKNMVSIESDRQNIERYIFNRPFDCIKILTGNSCDVLPKLDFASRAIVWLDYDARFTKTMLDDLSILIERSKSGTVICLTYNSEPYSREEVNRFAAEKGVDATYRNLFETVLGEENIPTAFDERGWSNRRNYQSLIREAICSRINDNILSRNHSLEKENELLSINQIMYFEYNDSGQTMNTLCFVLHDKKDKEKIDSNMEDCSFEFHNAGDTPYEITVPNFTLKEIRCLMEKMPSEIEQLNLNDKVFNVNDVDGFIKNYRYFPTFNEFEVL